MALAGNRRLRKEDIAHIFRKGRRTPTTSFIVWMLKKPTPPFRITVICSKKVDKRAVKRNTLRRRIREVFRKDIAPRMPEYDAVVQILPAGKNISTEEIKKTLYNVLHIS
jgi:ribonuclease P protein component